MKLKLREGMLICAFGIIGLMFILTSKTLSHVIKIPMTIFFILVLLIGTFIETPYGQNLLHPPDETDDAW